MTNFNCQEDCVKESWEETNLFEEKEDHSFDDLVNVWESIYCDEIGKEQAIIYDGVFRRFYCGGCGVQIKRYAYTVQWGNGGSGISYPPFKESDVK